MVRRARPRRAGDRRPPWKVDAASSAGVGDCCWSWRLSAHGRWRLRWRPTATFWTGAVGGDLAPKLAGGHESHGAPPGYHLLALPLLIFPATALLPAAAYTAWLRRAEPGVRFALAWLIPTWIVFEALPTKLVHYPLPAYGALAWLIAAAVTSPPALIWNRWTRGGGVVLSGLVGVAGALALVARLRDTAFRRPPGCGFRPGFCWRRAWWALSPFGGEETGTCWGRPSRLAPSST